MSLTESISARTTCFIDSTVVEDISDVQARLAGHRVEIVLEPTVADSFTGQYIAFTLMNMLVRLDAYCPILEAVLPMTTRHALLRLLSPGLLREAIEEFLAPFPAATRLTFHDEQRISSRGDLRVVIGPSKAVGSLSVWANGWIAYLNENAPVDYEDPNSIGASVAAGLATAEVFKRLLSGLRLRPGVKVLPLDHLVFSAFDYSLAANYNPPLPTTIDLGGAIVVGLGGIGSAFVAAASSLPSLGGPVVFLDADKLDSTNLNRHLIARPGDAGLKVDLCRRALAFHSEVEARPEWFGDFLATQGDEHELIVVGVDKDRVRREVQASLPRIILNAGTSDIGSFRVTRHDYLQGACLACVSRDDLTDNPVERELARQLGLDLATILSFRSSREPIPVALLRSGGVLSEENVQLLGDQPLAEIQRRVCGQLLLASESQPEEAVSISFLSALPGFLLLGELIKERSYPSMRRPPLNDRVNHSMLSVLGRPHPALLNGWREKREGCDCVRSAFQRAYRRKWLAGA